jgi:hypothetical protein
VTAQKKTKLVTGLPQENNTEDELLGNNNLNMTVKQEIDL